MLVGALYQVKAESLPVETLPDQDAHEHGIPERAYPSMEKWSEQNLTCLASHAPVA